MDKSELIRHLKEKKLYAYDERIENTINKLNQKNIKSFFDFFEDMSKLIDLKVGIRENMLREAGKKFEKELEVEERELIYNDSNIEIYLRPYYLDGHVLKEKNFVEYSVYNIQVVNLNDIYGKIRLAIGYQYDLVEARRNAVILGYKQNFEVDRSTSITIFDGRDGEKELILSFGAEKIGMSLSHVYLKSLEIAKENGDYYRKLYTDKKMIAIKSLYDLDIINEKEFDDIVGYLCYGRSLPSEEMNTINGKETELNWDLNDLDDFGELDSDLVDDESLEEYDY